MAITKGTTTSGKFSAVSSSPAVTVDAGSDCLVVAIAHYFNDTDLTSVTYNGVALTEVLSVQKLNAVTASIWRLLSPATGLNTLAITFAFSRACAWTALPLTGVDPGTPEGASSSVSGAGVTSSSVNVATSAGAFCVGVVALDDQNQVNVLTYTGSETQESNQTQVHQSGGADLEGGCGAGSDASSVTDSWSWSVALDRAHVLQEFLPSGAATTHHYLPLKGVG